MSNKVETKEKKPRENRGKDFEKAIIAQAAIYEKQGILSLSKTDPPVINFGKFIVVLKDNPYLDFVGVWTARGGYALFIEAKCTKTEYLRVDGADGSGGIDERQMKSLNRWAKAGAATGLLWKCNLGTVFVTTAELNKVYQRFGRKYISYDEAVAAGHAITGILFAEAINAAYPDV